MELTGLLDGVDLDFFMSDIIYPDKLTKILGTKVSVDTMFAPFIHTHRPTLLDKACAHGH